MDNDAPSKHSNNVAWTALVVVLPVLYILSIGPLSYAVKKWSLESSPIVDTLLVIYWPVIELMEHPSLEGPLTAYNEWWEELASRP